jgi:hypothetical protein
MIFHNLSLLRPRNHARPFLIVESIPYFEDKEGSMPVTSFLTMIFVVIAASGLTVVAVAEFGLLKVLPGIIVLGLLTRWGMSHVSGDDEPA